MRFIETTYTWRKGRCGGFQCGEKIGVSTKRKFCLQQKINVWEGFSGSFRGGLVGSNEETFWRETEGRVSIVKCGKMPLMCWGWGNLLKSSRIRFSRVLFICNGPIETVNTCGWIFDAWLIGFCHKTAKIHFFCTVDQLSKKCRNVRAALPNQLLPANADAISHQMEEYKNSGLVVILHCMNNFQHNNYVVFSLLYVLLRENPKINVIFSPLFHNGC